MKRSDKVRLIDIQEAVLAEDRDLAHTLRRRHRAAGTYFVTIMSSPGAGKTSLIERMAAGLAGRNLAVLEGDVDSAVDAERLSDAGIRAAQIRTGGYCHLSAPMVEAGLAGLAADGRDAPEWLFLENIGNLICPADYDTGAALNLVILSVPEGHDKPWKYPRIFQVADAVVINKLDYLPLSDFDQEAFRDRLTFLNPDAPVFPLSCRSGEGLDEFTDWLKRSRLRWLESDLS